MFGNLRVNGVLVDPEEHDGNNSGCVETRMRQAVESVADAFRVIENKYHLTLEEILDILEKHGYAAREILFKQQDNIDSDIYGRILAASVSHQEVDGWLTAVTDWEKEACQLVQEFEKIKKQQIAQVAIC